MEDIIHCGKRQIKFTVYGDPVPQGRPIFSRKTGTARDPKKSREYKQDVAEAAQEAVVREKWAIAHPEMPIRVHLDIFKPMPKSMPKWRKWGAEQGFLVPITKTGDIENIEKGILDGCSGIIYHDDCQVFGAGCEIRYSETPRVEVTMTAYFVNLGDIRDKAVRYFKSLPRAKRKNKEECK